MIGTNKSRKEVVPVHQFVRATYYLTQGRAQVDKYHVGLPTLTSFLQLSWAALAHPIQFIHSRSLALSYPCISLV